VFKLSDRPPAKQAGTHYPTTNEADRIADDRLMTMVKGRSS